MRKRCITYGVWTGLTAAALLQLPWPAVAETLLPPGGVSLLPADSLPGFLPSFQDDNIKIVPVTGQPFPKALSIATTRPNPPAAWSVQYGIRTAAPVKKGDTLFASFWMRTTRTQTGYGRADVYFQDATTYNKSIYYSASASSGWKHLQFPFTAVQDEAAGQAFLGFGVGFTAQTIEVAEVQVTDYGAAVKVSDLPTTRITYAGREPGAPWRKAAAARIERIRKGNLKVIVTDRAGRPLRDAAVSVRMTRHAFGFATAVSNGVFLPRPDTAYAKDYRRRVYRLYNKVTGNGVKWPEWEGTAWGFNGVTGTWYQFHPADTIAFARAARAHGLSLRAQNLLWPSWGYLPNDVEKLKNDPAALRKRIAAHITEEMTALKGLYAEWDVVNEPYSNHDLMDALGDHAMVDWFNQAHALDPQARLFVNDNGIMESNGEDTAHATAYEKTIQYLLDNKAPLGGIGMEGHYSHVLTPPDTLLKFLDRFGRFGLPIETTEFDINTTDEQVQADYTRDYMTTTFSHPAVSGFLMFGFWESDHWIPNAASWRKDWTIKPSGEVYTDLVFHQWWTDAQGRTDKAGIYRTRGFLGDYQITATRGGSAKTVPAKMLKNGDSVSIVRITLEESAPAHP